MASARVPRHVTYGHATGGDFQRSTEESQMPELVVERHDDIAVVTFALYGSMTQLSFTLRESSLPSAYTHCDTPAARHALHSAPA